MVYVSREIFNKWQAQRWWAENYDRIMELYNVQRFNQTVPLVPTTPKSEDEVRTLSFIYLFFSNSRDYTPSSTRNMLSICSTAFSSSYRAPRTTAQ